MRFIHLCTSLISAIALLPTTPAQATALPRRHALVARAAPPRGASAHIPDEVVAALGEQHRAMAAAEQRHRQWQAACREATAEHKSARGRFAPPSPWLRQLRRNTADAGREQHARHMDLERAYAAHEPAVAADLAERVYRGVPIVRNARGDEFPPGVRRNVDFWRKKLEVNVVRQVLGPQ